MKILVTGGCGFVGANICLDLKRKHSVYSLDNLSRKSSIINLKKLKENKIKNYKFDIFDSKKFSKLPKFDLIIDCCAEAAVEVSRKDIDKGSKVTSSPCTGICFSGVGNIASPRFIPGRLHAVTKNSTLGNWFITNLN